MASAVSKIRLFIQHTEGRSDENEGLPQRIGKAREVAVDYASHSLLSSLLASALGFLYAELLFQDRYNSRSTGLGIGITALLIPAYLGIHYWKKKSSLEALLYEYHEAERNMTLLAHTYSEDDVRKLAENLWSEFAAIQGYSNRIFASRGDTTWTLVTIAFALNVARVLLEIYRNY